MTADRDAAAVEKAALEIVERVAANHEWFVGSDGYRTGEVGLEVRYPELVAAIAALRREWTTAPCPTCGHVELNQVPCKTCRGKRHVPLELATEMEIIDKVMDHPLPRYGKKRQGEADVVMVWRYEMVQSLRDEARRRWLEDSKAGLHTKMEGNDE